MVIPKSSPKTAMIEETDTTAETKGCQPAGILGVELAAGFESAPIGRCLFLPRRGRFIRGVSGKLEEPALTLIPAFPYVAPFEELRLKK